MKKIYIPEELNENAGFWITSTKKIISKRSRYQDIELFETPNFGKALRIDKYWMTSEKDEFFYHESMVHPACFTIKTPKNILIIGGGDGGAAEEFLKHPSIDKVVLVEIDDEVIDFSKKHLSFVHNDVFKNPKLKVLITDGMSFVKSTKETFDIILLDLTDPHGPSEALYTNDFIDKCRLLLADNGILTMHIGSPIFRPNLLRRIISTLELSFSIIKPYFTYIPTYGTLWGMVTASNKYDPSKIDNKELSQRIKFRNVKSLNYYNKDIHKSLFALPEYVKKILAKKAQPITKQYPIDDEKIGPESQINVTINEN